MPDPLVPDIAAEPDVPSGPGGVLGTTERTRLRRFPEHGSHRRADLHAVLDAGFVCHLGILVDDWPMVVPTTYGRVADVLYVHGSVASRSLRAAPAGKRACVTVTHIDGLVLARSVFEHAVNYRCAMVYGVPVLMVDPADKLAGLEAISNQAVPGQWEYARPPTEQELAVTMVLRFELDEASVKVREGPPDDGEGKDAELGVWAGEVPLRTARLDPVADPTLDRAITIPEHVRNGSLAPGSVPWRDLA